MGSDLGPAELLRGVVSAASHYDAELCAVGQSEELNRIAKEQSIDLSGISILDAPDVITMEDKPMSVIREKNHSSMANGLRALSHGEADAFVSAGNTGALITGGTMIVRRIRGVMRAAIGTLFPFSAPVLLLDSGANLDVTPAHLEQFAFIGSLYMKQMFGIESPRVGLLNNGTEETKGNQLQIDTYQLLKSMDGINFVGNVEAKAIPFGVCDVVVTDGFTGNLFLKTVEGLAKYMSHNLKEIFETNLLTRRTARPTPARSRAPSDRRSGLRRGISTNRSRRSLPNAPPKNNRTKTDKSRRRKGEPVCPPDATSKNWKN